MMNLRTATIQDVLSLEKLVNSAYRGDYARQGWTTESDLLDGQRTDAAALVEIITAPLNQIELALDEAGRLVGCVHLKQESDSTLYFGMLTVEPKTQAKGVGKQLLSHLEGLARQRSLKHIRMTVLPQRKELIAFYERRGFQATGASEPFPVSDPRYGIPKVEGLILMEYSKFLEDV
jgi:ribosomal protein S18 acetylase RimI-like enzyme